MKSQVNPTLPAGSVFIQPSQTIAQNAALTGLQPNVSTSLPPSLQVWTPSPSGAITVSGVAPQRNSSNLVTLPSGQTVFMANLMSTSNAPTMPLSVSSSLPQSHMQVAPGLPTGSQIVLSNSTSNGQLASQISTPTVIQGPNGPISVGLSSGILTNTINSFNGTSGPFASNALGSLSTDQSVHIAQLVDSQIRPTSTCFTSTTGFQNLASVNQVILDSAGVSLGSNPNQNKGLSLPAVRPNIVCSSVQPLQQPHGGNTKFSGVSADVPTAQNAVTNSSTLSSDSPISSVPNDTTVSIAESMSTTTSLQAQPINVTTDSIAVQDNPDRTIVDVSDSTSSAPPCTISDVLKVDSAKSLFTPNSLNQLLVEIDPNLQLDPDAEEVINNLASEFITNCAEKARRLASHRGSSVVEAKDVLYFMEREWDIVVPGYVCDDRSLKKTTTHEAHKQRLALIKKQVKKM